MVMNTDIIRKDWAGRVVDERFPLLEWLGGSGQAGVFRTELQGPQPQTAVIRLVSADSESADSLLDVWASAAKLSHPHLMRIFGSGRVRFDDIDMLYVVTEYAEESLAQIIPERPLTAGETREMLVPVLDALTHLHADGLVYGRLKPSNIMVVADQLKLPIDHVYRAGSTRTPENLKIYDAPEVPNGVMSPAADSWSLGITLVEALTQHPPLWDRSTNRDPLVTAEVPQPFAEIARACLRYDSANRSAIRDLKSYLDPAAPRPELARKPDVAVSVPEPALRDREPQRFNSRVVTLVGAMVVLLALLVFFLVRSNRSQPSPPVTQSLAPAPRPVPAPLPAGPAPVIKAGSQKGEAVHRVMPDVQASATRTIHGKFDVKVRIDVDSLGAVSNAVFDSHASSRYFANKSLEAAQKWTFTPPQIDGKTVPSQWMLTFTFRKNGTEVKPVQIAP